MRLRTLLIMVTMLLGVLVLSGVALAVTKTCTNNPCVGTTAGCGDVDPRSTPGMCEQSRDLFGRDGMY
jgi:hypothetical protein